MIPWIARKCEDAATISSLDKILSGRILMVSGLQPEALRASLSNRMEVNASDWNRIDRRFPKLWARAGGYGFGCNIT